ncbi:MAG: RIO1 family regulatory kinase/ATPase [Anaerolineae bacterium]|nr:RIO1 family regulatory kinase/ATPase [Anaerolineae bacterium]
MSTLSDKYSFYEKYAHYAEELDAERTDRRARRHRRVRAQPPTYRERDEEVAELADVVGLEGGFNITYQPARHERVWLLQSLRPFYDQHLISDVLAIVKGGKEANVYLCAATPETGATWLAAKVYRPRMFRNLRNDKRYRQGRSVIGTDGKEVKDSDRREMRALNKKTSFGEQLAHTSWLMYEYMTLEAMYAAGGDVPQPVAVAGNAILMGYIGDDGLAAPALSEVRLERAEARPLFRRVLHNVALLLQEGLIHGDLSAYNILYWEGAVTLIDFPQVVDSEQNDEAYDILGRDVKRVCDYFNRYGLAANSAAITRQLWRQFVIMPDPEDVAADLSRLFEEEGVEGRSGDA